MKRILSGLFFLIILLVFPNSTSAKGEFTSDYKVLYDVQPSGITTVTEDITFTNQTDRYYPSSFSLTIGATKLSDVEARDSSGALPVSVTNLGKKTQVTVKFSNQQVVGQGKQYKWSLKFNSADFAQAQGKIWQVSVPKISSTEDIENYGLTLAVPVSFGDPTTILPEPTRQLESGGKLNFIFDKGKLTDNGILANFGSNQLFDYALEYHLSNDSFLPALAKISLPTDMEYQQVIINSLDPKPDNVLQDEDGNAVAFYKLDRKQAIIVKAAGLAKLSIKPDKKSQPLSENQKKIYTSQSKFWDKDSPQIKEKLKEIFKDGVPKINSEKARLIDKFVANYLQYDETRIKDNDFLRQGGLTALSNPSRALCSEFTDLFISLARAADIPSRQLIGYAYTANKDIRPVTFSGTVLHTWPEYYDEEQGWVMIDPTWESTTGGVDYFSKFDLNHFVLATRGASATSPISPDVVEVKFYDGAFSQDPKIDLSMAVSSEVFAGFPAKVNIKLLNSGNSLYPQTPFVLSSSKIGFADKMSSNSTVKSYNIGPLPPFGKIEFEFNLLTGPIWQSFDDVISVKMGELSQDRKITVKPFFAYKFFTYAVSAVIVLIVVLYTFVLTHHIKTGGSHISETGGLKKS